MAITLVLAFSDGRLLADFGGLTVATPLALAGLITYRMAQWVTFLDGEARRQRLRVRTDALTGLQSTSGLRSFVADAGDARAWSMVAIDLDGFRRINDAFGLEGGDATLQAAATAVNATRRHRRRPGCA